jgi:hypothetical protein
MPGGVLTNLIIPLGIQYNIPLQNDYKMALDPYINNKFGSYPLCNFLPIAL